MRSYIILYTTDLGASRLYRELGKMNTENKKNIMDILNNSELSHNNSNVHINTWIQEDKEEYKRINDNLLKVIPLLPNNDYLYFTIIGENCFKLGGLSLFDRS